MRRLINRIKWWLLRYWIKWFPRKANPAEYVMIEEIVARRSPHEGEHLGECSDLINGVFPASIFDPHVIQAPFAIPKARIDIVLQNGNKHDVTVSGCFMLGWGSDRRRTLGFGTTTIQKGKRANIYVETEEGIASLILYVQWANW